MNHRTDRLEAMYQSILDGEDEVAERLARDALAAGMAPLEAIDQGFIPGIREVGRMFGEGEFFLPELGAVELVQGLMDRKGDKQ